MKKVTAPLQEKEIRALKVGDEVLLSGVIHTARDAAHKRFDGMLRAGKRLPLDLRNVAIYYAGPTPARPGMPIGACGPTTSSRMDAYTPQLIARGLRCMIGKGDRSEAVRSAIKRYGCVYLIATGGLGALIATKVRAASVVCFKDLGPEAVYRLEVRDLPLIVAIDSKGNDIYAKAKWKKE